MSLYINESAKQRRKKLQTLSREINLNDMHYCNLQAIVEAESGRGAVEQYIQARSCQVLRDDLTGKDVEISKFKKSELSGTDENIPCSNGFEITEQKINSKNNGLARTNPEIFREVEMARYKITETEKPDKYIWVYRMGKLWVICN